MIRPLSFVLAFLLMLGIASHALTAKTKAVAMHVEQLEGSITIKDACSVVLDYIEGI